MLLNYDLNKIKFATDEATFQRGVGLYEDGKVTDFIEKPPGGKPPGKLSNGGIYILEPEILDYINDAGFCDFGFDVIPRLIEEKVPVYGYHLCHDEYLIDIGTIEKYCQANEDMNAGRVKIPHEE